MRDIIYFIGEMHTNKNPTGVLTFPILSTTNCLEENASYRGPVVVAEGQCTENVWSWNVVYPAVCMFFFIASLLFCFLYFTTFTELNL